MPTRGWSRVGARRPWAEPSSDRTDRFLGGVRYHLFYAG